MNTDLLQSKDAFCPGNRVEAIDAMAGYLDSLKFHKNEIDDFTQYWKSKLPSASHYCIYPQENRDIAGTSDLEITPKPARETRVWFFVVVEPTPSTRKMDIASQFKLKPLHQLARLRGASTSTTVGNRPEAIEVHEWGVSFIAEPGHP